MKKALSLLIFLFAGVHMQSSLAGGGQALSTKDLNDEIRATIMKEMSKAKQFKDDSDYGENGDEDVPKKKKNGCAMDVGSVKSPTGNGGRRVNTIVTGSVVQICN